MKKIYKVGIPVILRAKESVSRNCEIIIKYAGIHNLRRLPGAKEGMCIFYKMHKKHREDFTVARDDFRNNPLEYLPEWCYYQSG